MKIFKDPLLKDPADDRGALQRELHRLLQPIDARHQCALKSFRNVERIDLSRRDQPLSFVRKRAAIDQRSDQLLEKKRISIRPIENEIPRLWIVDLEQLLEQRSA